MALTASQIDILEIIERSTGTLSVISTLILLTTFCVFKEFRSLSNTLIFYASFANLFASAAALMGRSAIHNPNGALCQLQGFLLEMFMQSDALWACAMAINVYLCFFRRFDQVRLRRLHWIYAILCYGIPFIPAMVCLFYQDKRGKVYGDATLWCWIGVKYKEVRIYSHYLTIWISITISLTIYFRVGIVIYKVRAQIKAFEESSQFTPKHTFQSTTTIAWRTSSPVYVKSPSAAEPMPTSHPDFFRKFEAIPEADHDEEMSRSDTWTATHQPYSSTSHLTPPGPRHDSLPGFTNTTRASGLSSNSTLQRPPIAPLNLAHTHHSQHSYYLRQTLSPSTASSPNSIANFKSVISSPTTPTTPSHRHHTNQMDRLKWAYTKSALLFTISIFITWVPASANRALGLTHPNQPSFVLNAMSAFVLPLQGFWNTVIFFSSSWAVVRRLWRSWKSTVAADLERGRGAGRARQCVYPVVRPIVIVTKEVRVEEEEEDGRRRSSGKTLVGQEDPGDGF